MKHYSISELDQIVARHRAIDEHKVYIAAFTGFVAALVTVFICHEAGWL